MLISSHCFHCHSVIVGDRGNRIHRTPLQFHTREEKTTTADFRESKKPLLHFNEPARRPHPFSKRSSFIFPHNYNFTLKGSELKHFGVPAAWRLSKRIMFDLFFLLLIFPLCLGLPFPHLYSDKLRCKAVCLSDGVLAFKNTRLLR